MRLPLILTRFQPGERGWLFSQPFQRFPTFPENGKPLKRLAGNHAALITRLKPRENEKGSQNSSKFFQGLLRLL